MKEQEVYRLYTANTDVIEAATRTDVSACLQSTCDRIGNSGTQVVVENPTSYSIRTANTSSNGWGIQEDVTHTLDRTTGPAIAQKMSVRRLTPKECERLQGFPDNYTLVPHRGKVGADGPRYKALGNSMAVPCMRWIGERIQMVEDLIRPENGQGDVCQPE